MKEYSEAEAAFRAVPKPIYDIASGLGIERDDLEMYGAYTAKVSLNVLEKLRDEPDGKLILVTAINPTPAGEGKTTTTVGLGQAFGLLGKRSIIALREPSLGPLFGVKGGATGGGCAQAVPIENINLHFTGDIHAVTSANNLLSAAIDNHIFHGNTLDIDTESITWKRVMDMNDRALRRIIIHPAGKPRSRGAYMSGFEITAASEVMAVLCLSINYDELKRKLGNIIFGFDRRGEPVRADKLNVQGAMTALLKNALKPNLVQTYEHTPALFHGGPFANIAHGCNSLIATKCALKLADYVITEAGFGADLGGEKFLNIKCRMGNLKPDAAVIVATARALKMHGGVPLKRLDVQDKEAMKRGLGNLEKHVRNMKKFNLPVVVVINRFEGDTDEEIEMIRELCDCECVPITVSDVWKMCGAGGTEAAEQIIKVTKDAASERFKFLYDSDQGIREKITAVATEIYGADGVDFTDSAEVQLQQINEYGMAGWPVCMAKTPLSLSDDPKLIGRPTGFRIKVRGLKAAAGAGFVVAYLGNVMTMPGLPKIPVAEGMDVDEKGRITGMF